MLSARSHEKEWIDLGPDYYTEWEYYDCLKKLDRVGKWLGGDLATYTAINRLKESPTSILDVGCGGGFFAEKLARRYPQAQVLGIDLNPMAIEFANERPLPANLRIELRTTEELNEPKKSFDVVCATLMCHHLTDKVLVDFIERAVQIAKKGVIINDLHRHSLAYYLFKGISPLFFRNRLVMHDGPISISRGFIRSEWENVLEKAGVKNYKISWHPFFRWIVGIYE